MAHSTYDKVQILSIRNDCENIRFIANPCEKAQLLAVSKNASLIKSIDSPCEKAQICALRKDPTLIGFISNPCERAQLLAVSANAGLLSLIQNPSDKVAKVMIRKSSRNIHLIKSLSDSVKTLALKIDPSIIINMNDVTLNQMRTVINRITRSKIGNNIPSDANLNDLRNIIENYYDNIKNKMKDIEVISSENNYISCKIDDKREQKQLSDYDMLRLEENSDLRNICYEYFCDDVMADAEDIEDVKDSIYIMTSKITGRKSKNSSSGSVIRGGKKILIIDGDRATIRTNGKDYDASKVITGLRSNGLEVNNLPKEDLKSLLCGKKIKVNGIKRKEVSLIKSPIGYSIRLLPIMHTVNRSNQLTK